MSQQEGSGKTKALVAAMVVAIVIAGAIIAVLKFAHPKNVMVTELYKYYPEQTQLFVEFDPGQKLQSRFFSAVDTVGLRHSTTYTAKADKLEALLQPEMSFGVWFNDTPAAGTDKNAAQQTPEKVDGHVLAVLDTKPGFTFEKLADAAQLPKENFVVEKTGDITYFKSSKPDNKGMFALDGQHLLFSSDKGSLDAAIAEAKTPKSVADNPNYRKNLAYLPAQRQGTIFMDNLQLQELSQKVQQQNANARVNVQKFADLQKQMQKATPIMVAGISVKNDELISVDTFTPVKVENIDNQELKQDLGSLLKSQANFNMPQVLPVNTVAYGGMMGLGQYYDLFMKYVANDQDKARIQQTENQLKMIGLDWRKNVIALIDGQAGFGLMADGGKPDFLLFLNNSADTVRTLDQMSMVAAQMTRGNVNEKQVDDTHKIKVLESALLPIRLAYSSVEDNKTLVFGTQAGVDNMYEVKQSKEPSLSQDKVFKAISASWPQQVCNVFYINVTKGNELIDTLQAQKAAGRPIPSNPMKEMLQGIEAVGGANSIDDKSNIIRGYYTLKLAAEKAAAPTK